MNQSVCDKCANIDLAIKSLSKHLPDNAKTKTECDLLSKHKFLERTLCPKEDNGFYSNKCYTRQCSACGSTTVHNKLKELAVSGLLPYQIVMQRWQLVPVAGKQTDSKKGAEKKQMKFVEINFYRIDISDLLI